MSISPSFSTPGLLLTVALTAYLAFAAPWLGKRQYDRLARRRDHDPRALVHAYRLWIAEEWVWLAVTALILVLSPGLGPADLGFAMPGNLGQVAPAVVGMTSAIVIGTVVLHRLARSGRAIPGQAAVAELMPRTSAERWHGLAMAVTAGVCEEIVYRGLLIAFGVGVLGLSTTAAAALALVVFVAGHFYQGWKGMVVVALLGFWLTIVYVSTGSLLLPILAHILIDVRGLVFMPASGRKRVGQAG
ncbi:CPBP family intramembrane glutamic endopeptidase [Microbispora sp. KK1-11]|uniref:CPBP family intramembrane glutamic endopeptidase n=1 Tax=Microbispora sp. KK1-11 TaxID=2053005 RepID=UPI0011580979|nr:CPBP family intramembrane glutamic endopeptidase [Microbispora sp. KK1-11]TQS25206.1 CPBP family intramembrane metalloprotease [Microbispora sp. KK1-11]